MDDGRERRDDRGDIRAAQSSSQVFVKVVVRSSRSRGALAPTRRERELHLPGVPGDCGASDETGIDQTTRQPARVVA